MASVKLTQALREEYQQLFDTCQIRPEKAKEVEALVSKITQNRDRYVAVGDPMAIPWYVVGVIHNMESSLNFNKHLHNGDPLNARTVHVPPNRPRTGNPPFTWEESAEDALRLEGLDQAMEWTWPATLYRLEAYNGFGYRLRHPEVLSPYLWSFSNHHRSGKFVADGTFSPTAASAQCGAAVLLRRMAESGTIQFAVDGTPITGLDIHDEGKTLFEDFGPLIQFSTKKKSEPAETLQRALNALPGIFLKVDGVPGEKTSDAFRKVTGHFLQGDPRA